MTTLAVLKKTDTVLRHRDHGLRNQFNYYLPMVGQVKAHGNKLNQNASVVELRWFVSWFSEPKSSQQIEMSLVVKSLQNL
ncbi:hypothetical protein PHMEG_00032247 [Phytophthora megakarya]|uniref:Uncharacterized protein n=1 Tax=Phytophthora megakarya TaxID=4795 RepID=A0A225UW41_9STRA|nr:hypothetical protein PHMEG_00032247 [Phytophthora megakarya]